MHSTVRSIWRGFSSLWRDWIYYSQSSLRIRMNLIIQSDSMFHSLCASLCGDRWRVRTQTAIKTVISIQPLTIHFFLFLSWTEYWVLKSLNWYSKIEISILLSETRSENHATKKKKNDREANTREITIRRNENAEWEIRLKYSINYSR